MCLQYRPTHRREPARHRPAEIRLRGSAVKAGRIRIFRRQPIVDGDHGAAAASRELHTLRVIGVEITEYEGACMAIKITAGAGAGPPR